MSTLYFLAALLAFGVGLAHSVLGERYILVRLFRRDNLPKLFGGTEFTTRTLRFAWHITTVAWWGAAAIFVCLAPEAATPGAVSAVLAATFIATAAITLTISRGRHLAWPVFATIGLIAWYGV